MVTWKLKISIKEKVALCITMSLGVVVAVISAVRTAWMNNPHMMSMPTMTIISVSFYSDYISTFPLYVMLYPYPSFTFIIIPLYHLTFFYYILHILTKVFH